MDEATEEKLNDFLEGLKLPYLCIVVDDEGLAQFNTNMPMSMRLQVLKLTIHHAERGQT